jgi:hypothetical protein
MRTGKWQEYHSSLGQPVVSPREGQLVLPHLGVQECPQLLHVALHCRGSLHGEYCQHLIDPLQRKTLRVGEHAQDVGPEHAQFLLPLVCTAGNDAVLFVLLQAVGDTRHVPQSWSPLHAPLLDQTEGVWCVLHRYPLGLPEGDLPAKGGEGHLKAGGQLLGRTVSNLLELVDDS